MSDSQDTSIDFATSQFKEFVSQNHPEIPNDLNRTLELISYKSEILEPKPKALIINQIQPFKMEIEINPYLVKICGGTYPLEDERDSIGIEELLSLELNTLIVWKHQIAIEGYSHKIAQLFDNDPIIQQSFYTKLAIIDGDKADPRKSPQLCLEVLAEIIHPNEFDFGHRNDVWEFFKDIDPRI